MRERKERVFADPPQPQREMRKAQGLLYRPHLCAALSSVLGGSEEIWMGVGKGGRCALLIPFHVAIRGEWFVFCFGTGWRSIWGLGGVCFEPCHAAQCGTLFFLTGRDAGLEKSLGK